MRTLTFSDSYRNLKMIDTVAVCLGTTGTICSVALFFDIFHPKQIIWVSTFATLLILLLFISTHNETKVSQLTRTNRPDFLTMCMLGVVALFFRWNPYTFQQGGQDQGLYVNMATALARWGSIRFPDEFRVGLDLTSRDMYDQTKLLSYSLVDATESLMTIEFYPLHPALMALAQQIFGGLGHESLTVVSMLGVFAAWHLALEIDGRKSVAILFTTLVAVNPALTFFAKFPVSETIALSFVLFGFLYLIKYLKASRHPQRLFFLVISLINFNCLFYVRWQFLLYIPFFLVAFVSLAIMPSFRSSLYRFVLFLFTVTVLAFIAFLFYSSKQPELYTPMRDAIMEMLPTTNFVYLIFASITALLVFVISLRIGVLERCRVFIRSRISLARCAPYVLLTAVASSVLSIQSLYAREPMYPWGYDVPVTDIWVIRYHVLYRLMLYVGPLLIMIVIFSGLRRPTKNVWTSHLIIFTAVCLLGILMRPAVPYLYYYGRYLVVDLLPALLLLGSIQFMNLMESKILLLRRFAQMSIALTVVYSVFFSSLLIGKYEGEDSQFFEEVSQVVRKNDVVLLLSVSQQIILPLRINYGLNVAAISTEQNLYSADEIFARFREVANDEGGAFYYLVPKGAGPSKQVALMELVLTDNFFTNTDHFRDPRSSQFDSWKRLFLPMDHIKQDQEWQLFLIPD